jgi:F-type H+-transporting ATPase subunit a
MEHPYLFLVKVFEWFGPGAAHFAHAYPYIIYSWFVMIFLIVCAAIATKGISMIPTKGQNFFEIVISGMEEFMVDITGEEGRWFFPCRSSCSRITSASSITVPNTSNISWDRSGG